MADVLVFGVVAADVVLRVNMFPRSGEHVHADAMGWRVGGSSANVACGLSSAGHHVSLVGPVGNDGMGNELIAELHRRRVDTSYVFRADMPSPRTLVVLDHAGERTMLSVGRDPPHRQFMPPSDNIPDPSAADCVYVESYTRYPSRLADAAGDALLVASPPVEGFASWPADVVIGSVSQYGESELEAPYQSVEAVAGDRLQWVVVTRGAAGADAYGVDRHVHAHAPQATQVDATGAGDAFAAGLVHALLGDADIAAAMGVGAAWAAESVSCLQSLPPSWVELFAAPELRA